MMPAPHPDEPHPLTYTRVDAIVDGLLIEVPTRLRRQFGITWPLAVTTLAWFDAIGWDSAAEHCKPRPTHETECGRIAEVLFAARLAVTTNPTGAHNLPFTVHRVPPTGPVITATRCTLQLSIHPGDHGETVATISHPTPTAAGRFTIGSFGDPDTAYPAVSYDEDPDHVRSPIVTTDTLDTILTDAAVRRPDIKAVFGHRVVHVAQPGAHPVSLRPDPQDNYHLRLLGWSYRPA